MASSTQRESPELPLEGGDDELVSLLPEQDSNLPELSLRSEQFRERKSGEQPDRPHAVSKDARRFRHLCTSTFRFFDRASNRKVLAALALGQVLSLLVTVTGYTSSVLSEQGIDVPTTQSWLNYLLLSLVYGGPWVYRRRGLEAPARHYLGLSLLDVEANYLVVLAYQYTSITSVMLLDCFTIPCVLLFTRLLLHVHYKPGHFLGVATCVAGLVLLVFSDVHAADHGAGKSVLLGDLLVICASVAYAATNVGEEFLVKKIDRVELLAMLGFFGLLWNTGQLLLLERRELLSVTWSTKAIIPMAGFAVALFAFYTLVPFMLQMAGSAMFNLSLLTSDMWAVAVRALLLQERVDKLYYVSFITVAVGLVLYSRSGEPHPGQTSPRVPDSGSQNNADDDDLRAQWTKEMSKGRMSSSLQALHEAHCEAEGIGMEAYSPGQGLTKDCIVPLAHKSMRQMYP